LAKIKRSGKFHRDAIPNKTAGCMLRARINPLAVEHPKISREREIVVSPYSKLGAEK
jgi:hypothetical protein